MNEDPEPADPHAHRRDDLAAGLDTDPEGTFRELLRLAPKSVTCMELLAWAYDKGLGTPVDPDQAEAWYARAAKEGLAEAWFYLGDHFLGLEEFQRAREAFATGAARGDTRSQESLEQLDRFLQSRRLNEAYNLLMTDPTRAVEPLRRLVDEGSGHAMLYLGWAYATGTGIPEDLEQAKTLYRKAYELGVDSAEDYLGYRYYYEGCVQQAHKNYADAFKSFTAGAQVGYSPAMLRLGNCYAHGLGVKRNRKKARELYEQAAARGSLIAKRNVAVLWITGRYGLRNILRGVRMFKECVWEIVQAVNEYAPDQPFPSWKDKRLLK